MLVEEGIDFNNITLLIITQIVKLIIRSITSMNLNLSKHKQCENKSA